MSRSPSSLSGFCVLALLFPLLAAAQSTAPQTAAPQPPAPQPASSLPAMPTPLPADSVPSMPAPVRPVNGAVPAYPTPQQSSTPPPAMPAGTYADPLLAPLPSRPAPNNGAPQPAEVRITAPTVVSMPPSSLPAYSPFEPVDDRTDALGSTYIPVDSPIYPMAMRLYSLGYLNTAFLSMRPWTRRSLLHALQATADDVMNDMEPQAQAIFARLMDILQAEVPGKGFQRGKVYGVENVYTRLMGITGTPLHDSYHIGQTLVNDYGRPYAKGFNNVTGFTSTNEWGRFSFFVRGESQHAPASNAPYTFALANTISCLDQICPLAAPHLTQATILYGRTAASVDTFRIQEAALSFHLLGHEISFGKSDSWMGPGMGGSLAFSNNAENVYAFRINRVEPMYIPIVKSVLGPLRYDFFVGSLQGHTAPNNPWVHSAMFNFAPSSNFQFGFQRTVIWGGHGHGCFSGTVIVNCNQPITLHTFLKSFFDINDTTPTEKYSRNDPGARFSAFNFSYRLPFFRHVATLYADSITHDDVTPISAPRRAGWRPGLFLARLPYLPQMDLRAEGVYTDFPTLRSVHGVGNYYETVQLQGYTNKGFIMGDWIGREGKGGQAWLTYHLGPEDFIQVSFLRKTTSPDFIPLGVNQTDFKAEVNKRLYRQLYVDAWFQLEHWKAPVYLPGSRNNTTIAAQFTYRPRLHTSAVATGR